MKLLSLNVEGMRFYKNGLRLCDTEQPDTVCLMEAPEACVEALQERGYQVTFAPMTRKIFASAEYTEGLLLATSTPHSAITHYYHSLPAIAPYVHERRRETIAHPVIIATTPEGTVATTHFTWNPHGEIADEHQITDLEKLLFFLDTQPPHVLCGDFNIPRFQNHLYEDLTKRYTDTVPREYASSLDRTHHRVGDDPTKQHLFASFMVDYLFTQPPYQATSVRLEFGVSDHAAVLGEITGP